LTMSDMIRKSLDGEDLRAEEIKALFEVPLFSEDSARIQLASRHKSQKACGGKAEVHGQVGLNIGLCPMDCYFCAFAACNGIFEEEEELTPEEAVRMTKDIEASGGNAVFVMSTAQYPFEKYLEMGREIRRNLRLETTLIANVGDMTEKQAVDLKQAGFSGVYHALRLGEGRDTRLSPERRLRTFQHVHAAGLGLGTCVEPVGPEHSVEELVEKTLITREARPVYSGSARRIPLPGTKMGGLGMVSEARMAHILAVVRLSLGYDVPGNCTHEPNVIGAAAGANLFWAESGSNPRDTASDTAGHRGMTVEVCRNIFKEAEWEVLDGVSRFYEYGK
jgi:biotin synthase